MENVLFKISYPAEFHAQTAVECAHILHGKLKEMGKSSDDIKEVVIRTQDAAVSSVAMLCSGGVKLTRRWADPDHRQAGTARQLRGSRYGPLPLSTITPGCSEPRLDHAISYMSS